MRHVLLQILSVGRVQAAENIELQLIVVNVRSGNVGSQYREPLRVILLFVRRDFRASLF
jgi:hypothetical protein